MKMNMLDELQIAIYLGQSGQKLVAVSSLPVDEKYPTPAAPAFTSCAFHLLKITCPNVVRWTLTSAGPRSSF